MAVYRIYLVHDDGRLEPDESFYCKTDEDALRRLKPSPRQDIRAELWQGGRFIAVAFLARRHEAHRPHVP
jgi:hypothetical protein